MSRNTRRLYSGKASVPPEAAAPADPSEQADRTSPDGAAAAPSGRLSHDDDGPTVALPVDDDGPTVALPVGEVGDAGPGQSRARARVPVDATQVMHSEGAGATAVMAAPPAPTRCPQCGSRASAGAKFCPFDGAPLVAEEWDSAADPLVGKVVSDRYLVEAVLAEGGMGTVYRVRHTKLQNAFAMKILRRDLAEDAQVATRLIEEARATAAIGHPNIVSVADSGEIDASLLPELGDVTLPFFVMEYLRGPSLAELVAAEGSMTSERVAHITLQVAGALEAAHKAGIVHRDLKPSNIRLTSDELGGEIAKVLDFGVAKVMGASKRTQQGMVFGTPHYMSPEQGQGKPIDLRTDVYALGIIMYECLTGEVPFAADTFMGVITKHIFERPERRQWPGGIALEPIMMRCLEKDPAARYPSMAELIVDLERALEGKPEPSRGARARPFRLRGDDDASGGRLSIPGVQTTSWWWMVAAVAVLGAAGYVAIRASGRESSASAPTPSASAAAPALTASEATSGPAGRSAATSVDRRPPSSADASASPLPTAGPAAGPTARPEASPSATVRPPRTVGSPPPRPPPATPDGIVDPWSN